MLKHIIILIKIKKGFREKSRLRAKEWYSNNKARVKEKYNPEVNRVRCEKYREKNLDKIKQKAKIWREKNPARVKSDYDKWYSKNREEWLKKRREKYLLKKHLNW